MDLSEGSHHSDIPESVTLKRRVLINASAAALQTLISGGVLFFLYRYLLRSIGAMDLGVWALVLATTSSAGLANLGIATSTVKFVSQSMAQNEPRRADRIVQTSAISVAAILALVLPLVFPLLQLLLENLIEPAEKIPSGLLILPYALLSFWFNAVAGVFQACIDGLHRIDMRALLLIVAMPVYLALVYWLVPINGIEGLAQAQLIQAALLLVASWIVLKRLMPGLPVVPFRWTYSTFRSIIGYSLNFQVISISQFLMEPVAKAIMSRFAGVGTLAYFEMAQRMVFQLRALIAAAHQAVVPAISTLLETAPDRLASVYRQSFRSLVFFAGIALPFFIMITPFVSYLWIGSYNDAFIDFARMIFAGWFLNLLANPAYFANLGTGDLRWNVIGHLLMGGLNVGLCLMLGALYGAKGIVAGFVTAILAGSCAITMEYHRKHRLKLQDLLASIDIVLVAAATGGMSVALVLFTWFRETWTPPLLAAVGLGVFVAAVIVPFWRHPMRREVGAWFVALANPASPPASS